MMAIVCHTTNADITMKMRRSRSSFQTMHRTLIVGAGL